MHDARRHLNSLRLSLGQDKAPLGLLLASGCSAAIPDESGEPLIPTIVGMTAQLHDLVTAGPAGAAHKTLLECLAEDGIDDPTVEDWLSHVRALHLVARGATVRGLSRDDLESLERAITDGVVTITDKPLPANETAFHSVASWAGAVARDLPVELFTTNYDLLIEQACEARRHPYFDGFVGARRPFFDNASVTANASAPLPARFTRLWKLHGSVNWYLDEGGEVVRARIAPAARRLIHPSHLKYDESRQMPYLALLDRLRDFLSQRGALLVVCGYSFGDQHINAVLRSALQANPTAVVIGLLFGPLADHPAACALAEATANLGMYALDQAVVGTRTGPWMCDGRDDLPVGLELRDDETWVVNLGDFAVFGRFLQSLLDIA